MHARLQQVCAKLDVSCPLSPSWICYCLSPMPRHKFFFQTGDPEKHGTLGGDDHGGDAGHVLQLPVAAGR
jgi:hypothetical protein